MKKVIGKLDRISIFEKIKNKLSIIYGQGCIRRDLIKVFKCYSADSDYEVTLMTKTTVYYNGAIVWRPPAIYKSSCAIDVEYFPYDAQTCFLKMGSWTYSGFQVRPTVQLLQLIVTSLNTGIKS